MQNKTKKLDSLVNVIQEKCHKRWQEELSPLMSERHSKQLDFGYFKCAFDNLSNKMANSVVYEDTTHLVLFNSKIQENKVEDSIVDLRQTWDTWFRVGTQPRGGVQVLGETYFFFFTLLPHTYHFVPQCIRDSSYFEIRSHALIFWYISYFFA